MPTRRPDNTFGLTSGAAPGRVRLLALVVGGVLALLAALRFLWLTERPIHHDEAVNFWMLERLLVHGDYRYDPTNYHGPSLYYLQVLITWASALLQYGLGGFEPFSIQGTNEWSLRAGVAAAGALCVAAPLLARHWLGIVGAIASGVLLGASSTFLYYSRDFIHEMVLIVFTLVIWIAALRFGRSRQAGALDLLAFSTALWFCTKETALLTLAALVVSRSLAEMLCAERSHPFLASAVKPWLLDLRAARPSLGSAFVVLLGTWFLLFSSFLRNLGGPLDSFAAFRPWFEEAVASGHEKPAAYFVREVLWRYEPAMLIVGAIGLGVAVVTRRRIGIQLAAWTLIMLGGYSAIPYKTPWLALNFLLPLGLLGGWGFGRLWELGRGLEGRSRAIALPGLAAAFSILASLQLERAWPVVFREYDIDSHALVYSQTRRSALPLIRETERYLDTLAGEPPAIEVVAPEYWPLPFYFRNHEQANFWGRLDGIELGPGVVVVGAPDQRDALRAQLGDHYQRSAHDLRPGVILDLYLPLRGVP